MTTCIEEEAALSHHDRIINLLNEFLIEVTHTSITPTSRVIDLLLDIRNITDEWEHANG